MWIKVKGLLGSIRFWLVVIFAIAYSLGYGNVINDVVAKAVQFSALIIATIGTIDKFSEK